MPQTVIKNVSVVPMRWEGVLSNQDVLIRNGVIVEVQPTSSRSYGSGVAVMPGDGKFLMPGLFDMHTHASDRVNRSQLYLLHGVTTVRDTACVPELFPWRAKNPPGAAMVPEVYAPGPVLEGKEQYWKGKDFSRVVIGKKQVGAAINEAQNLGADFIKVYHTLDRADYLYAAQVARQRGLKVAGHVHKELTIDDMAGALDSLEHADGLVRRKYELLSVQNIADKAIPAFVRENVALSPTLILTKQAARITKNGPDALKRELADELIYIRVPEWWEKGTLKRTSKDLNRAAKLTGILYNSSVRLLLGTDSNNPYVLPGHSTIQELGLLVMMAGLTPYEALRTGTVDAAEFLGVNAGTVEPGQKANLVLVGGNPLGDVTALEKPTDVFVRGKHFTRETLEQSLEVVS